MDSRKKIASVMAGINLALGIASMAGAASAAADGPGDYIYDLNNHGIGGSRQNLLQLGQNVACKRHRQGFDAEPRRRQVPLRISEDFPLSVIAAGGIRSGV